LGTICHASFGLFFILQNIDKRAPTASVPAAEDDILSVCGETAVFMYDIVIIGAGISGCSIAYYLSRYNLKVALLEKENDVACATTKANSAIVHAAMTRIPALMANTREGQRNYSRTCQKTRYSLPAVGSYVLAFA
jgi:hypothetical protein